MNTDLRVEDGLLVQDAVAPPIDTLRPLVPAEKDVFPVYQNLQGEFLSPPAPLVQNEAVPPGRLVARTLAVCAGYSYSDAQTVSTMLAHMGLEENRCRMIAMTVDAMFVDSTAFVVQSRDGRVVIVSYRGTEPLNLLSWLTDASLTPTAVRVPGEAFPTSSTGDPLVLHGGFYRNVRAIRYEVINTLKRAAEGLPVTSDRGDGAAALQPMKALYITGHSLGAAMAAIETMLLRITPENLETFGAQMKGTYCFAQPRVGNKALADACEEVPFLKDNVYRFVYNRDPVPHLPSRDLGVYANFGREYGVEGSGWKERTGAQRAGQMPLISNLVTSGLLGLASLFPVLKRVPLQYRLDDHAPQHYIEALTEPGELTEFGDYVYQ
jgi:Lipase (class 3)